MLYTYIELQAVKIKIDIIGGGKEKKNRALV